jgi:hypothetical protein
MAVRGEAVGRKYGEVLAGDVLTGGERGRGVRVRGGVCGQRAGCAGCNLISCAFLTFP